MQAPTLLVEAEFTVVPPGVGERMVSSYSGPDLRYLKVDGAGHLVHDDAPGVFRGAVEAFLSGLD